MHFKHQIARVTLPERRQRVQTLIRRGVPFTIALTFLTFGFQVLFERLCEWDTLIPKAISLLQISHLAMVCTSFSFHTGISRSHSKCYHNRFLQKNQVFFLLFSPFIAEAYKYNMCIGKTQPSKFFLTNNKACDKMIKPHIVGFVSCAFAHAYRSETGIWQV